MNLHGSAIDNRSGEIQALDDLAIDLGNGALDNRAGLIRAGQTLSIAAHGVDNRDSAGPGAEGLGLEGQSVSIAAAQIDNQSGAIRANAVLTLSSGGGIDNRQGLIASGHSLTLQDRMGRRPAAKTLAIGNSDGTLIAGHWLGIDSASLTGDGDLLSQGDIGIQLSQSYSHGGHLQADGNATWKPPAPSASSAGSRRAPPSA